MSSSQTHGLQAVVYVSSATVEFDTAALERLLSEARERNRETGVTGVLLFSDGNFMQYFEGDEAAVQETYARIRASSRHGKIIQLMHEDIVNRSFPEWEMGFAQPTESEMLRLSTARWRKMQEGAGGISPKPDGITFLEQFWKLSQRS